MSTNKAVITKTTKNPHKMCLKVGQVIRLNSLLTPKNVFLVLNQADSFFLLGFEVELADCSLSILASFLMQSNCITFFAIFIQT